MRLLSAAVLLAPLLLGACAIFQPPPHYVVYFEQWSADLDAPAKGAVAEAAAWAKLHPAAPVQVRGYADPAGTPAASHGISAKRAAAVTQLLEQDGVNASNIRVVALGATPFALDSVESRRVEIVLGAN